MIFTLVTNSNDSHYHDITFPRVGRLRGVEIIADLRSEKLRRIRLIVNRTQTIFSYSQPELEHFRSTANAYAIPIGINYDEAIPLQTVTAQVNLVIETDLVGSVSVISHLYEEQDPRTRNNYNHQLLFRRPV